MKLYDAQCRKCGSLQFDVLASKGTDIDLPCSCGGRMEWMPTLGRVDAQEPFHDPHLGITVSSYRELEKHADAAGAAVVPAKEYDSMSWKTTEDRLKLGDAKRRAAVERTYYRLMNGYKD